MGFRGGGKIDPPPCISWFSSTPVEIGLISEIRRFKDIKINIKGFSHNISSKQKKIASVVLVEGKINTPP